MSTNSGKKKPSKIKRFTMHTSRNLLSCADFFSPLAHLAIRWWMAVIFWKSGILKLSSWDTTLMLFEDEHPVPGLSPEFAAYMGTTNELVLPILLIIGLGSRIAAFMMLFMTFVIQFTYMNMSEHAVWAIMLVTIILSGPGRFSWDFFIRNKYFDETPSAVSSLSRSVALVMVVALTVFSFHEILTLMIDEWNTPWLNTLGATWDDINKWLGGFYRD